MSRGETIRKDTFEHATAPQLLSCSFSCTEIHR